MEKNVTHQIVGILRGPNNWVEYTAVNIENAIRHWIGEGLTREQAYETVRKTSCAGALVWQLVEARV